MAEKSGRKPRILIVDDDSMIRSFLRLMLREDGYEVVGEAGSGENLVNLCRATRAELVLLDINLPGIDGLQALETLRNAHPEMRVIMISAEATLDRVQQAMAKGARGFIVKPFNAGKVLSDIAACL
ncbi:MAG: response regulator transcription factor [Burkholderiales bacterium]